MTSQRSLMLPQLLAIILALAVSGHAAVLFEDDFEDGLDPSWVIDNRTSHPDGMSVVDGRLVVHESSGFATTSVFALVGDATWEEYTVELEFTPTSGSGVLGIHHHISGDWSGIWGSISGYAVDLGWQDQLKLNRVDAGVNTQLAFMDTPAQDLAPGVTYRVITEIRDGVFRFRYFPVGDPDPGWQFEIQDSGYTAGYLFIHTWNTLGYFDNVRVTDASPADPPVSDPPQFVDISANSGLPAEQMRASAMADLDADGDLDFLAVRDSDLALLRFENTGGQFVGAAVPVDQAPDFRVGTLRLLDFDRDGDLDLLGLDDGTAELRLYRSEPSGFVRETLVAAPDCSRNNGSTPTVVDFDGDGWPDIVYHGGTEAGFDLVVLKNQEGSFADAEILVDVPADHFVGDFVLFDLDNDGDQDLIQGSQPEEGCLSAGFRTVPLEVYRNDGDAGVAALGRLGLPEMCLRNALVPFDADNDGWLDLTNGTADNICNGGLEQNWLLFNEGGDQFVDGSDPSMNVGSHYYARKHPADVDLDGDLDYFQQVSTWTHARLFMNNLDGTFDEVSELVGLTYGSGRDGSADNYWLDLDGDGDLDLVRFTRTVYPAGEGLALVYRNDARPAQWLAIDARPAASIKTLVGLRVTAHVNGQSMTRSIRDYQGPVIHFGLGAATSVDSLTVVWPSGEVESLGSQAANQVVLLEETPRLNAVAISPVETTIDCAQDSVATLTVRLTTRSDQPPVFAFNAQMHAEPGLVWSDPTLIDPDLFGPSTLFLFQDQGDGSYVISASSTGGDPLCLEGDAIHDLFAVTYGAGEEGSSAISFDAFELRGADNAAIPVSTAGATVTVDCTDPPAVTDMIASPGHDRVTVAWSHDGQDLDHFVVYRAIWRDGATGQSAYPEYDDLPDNLIPHRPVSLESIDGTVWELVANDVPASEREVVDQGMTTGRGVYFYEVFAVDACGRSSVPAPANARATNYWLGDVSDLGDPGTVGIFDVSVLGDAFGVDSGHPDYDPVCDIGPTDDSTASGIPATDDRVDFEDLILLAFNFGTVGADKSVPVMSEQVELAWVTLGQGRRALHLVSGSGLLGLRLRGGLPADLDLTVRPGSLLGSESGYFLQNVGPELDVSLVALGATSGIRGVGELFVVEGNKALDVDDLQIDARNLDNQPVEVLLSGAASPAPLAFGLNTNYPNPFNPATTIRFSLPEAESVSLRVYTVNGRLVRELLGERLSAGHHEVTWQGNDQAGRPVAAGTYFCVLRAGDQDRIRKMSLIK